MRARWANYDDPSGIHTAPLDDDIEHILNDDECICGPRAECLTGADGQDVWHFVHHSLDGREQAE